MDNRLLNIIDERGNVVGTETREKIHREELLHRIVHVWFYIPDGKLIFQRRGIHADTYPNTLDATVGGHVEIGKSYDETAVAETVEETGVAVNIQELTNLGVVRMSKQHLSAVYAYKFSGAVSDLRPGEGEDTTIGFEAIDFKDLFNLNEEQKKRIIPSFLRESYAPIFKKMGQLM